MLAVLLTTLSLPLVNAQGTFDPASASANDFVRVCSVVEKGAKTLEDIRNGVACVAFVGGLEEGALTGVAYVKRMTFEKISYPFCLPVKLTKTQTLSIVLKYIRNHPERAQEFTAFLFVDALHEAFPCKE
jgi:hypothetical protein